MLLKILLLFGLAALPFGGCGQQSPEELFAAGEAAATDPASLDQAVGHFKAFLEKFDQDPKAPEALNKLAALAQQQGQMQEAIAYYERVLADYPDSGRGDEAQLMIAFIFEEYVFIAFLDCVLVCCLLGLIACLANYKQGTSMT